MTNSADAVRGDCKLTPRRLQNCEARTKPSISCSGWRASPTAMWRRRAGSGDRTRIPRRRRGVRHQAVRRRHRTGDAPAGPANAISRSWQAGASCLRSGGAFSGGGRSVDSGRTPASRDRSGEIFQEIALQIRGPDDAAMPRIIHRNRASRAQQLTAWFHDAAAVLDAAAPRRRRGPNVASYACRRRSISSALRSRARSRAISAFRPATCKIPSRIFTPMRRDKRRGGTAKRLVAARDQPCLRKAIRRRLRQCLQTDAAGDAVSRPTLKRVPAFFAW